MVPKRTVKLKTYLLIFVANFCVQLFANTQVESHVQSEAKLKEDPFQAVHIEGNTFFRSNELKQIVLDKLNKSRTVNRKLEQLSYQIKLIYRRAGFDNVEVKIENQEDGSILVNIAEGSQALVDNIEIEGASYFAKEWLTSEKKNYVSSRLKDKHLWFNLDKGDLNEILSNNSAPRKNLTVNIFDGSTSLGGAWLPYDSTLFAEAKDFIREIYYKNGFLEAKIIGPKVLFSKNKNFVKVLYRIQEKEQVFVDGVSVSSDESRELKSFPFEFIVKKGDFVNAEIVEKQRILIEEHYLDSGFPFASVDVKIDFNDKLPVVNIDFIPSLGKKVVIDDIQILGNDVTKKKVILKRFKIKPGDDFSFKKIMESRQELYKTDLFDSVDIYLDPENQQSEKKKLIVDVKEKIQTTLEFGVGVSLEDGPRFLGVFQHRNLFGLGISSFARLQLNYPALFYNMPLLYSPLMAKAFENRFAQYPQWLRPFMYTEGKLVVGFSYPEMLQIPFSTDGSIDGNLLREIRPTYNANKFSIEAGFKARFLPWLHSSSMFELEYTKFDTPAVNHLGQGYNDRFYGDNNHLDRGTVSQFTWKLLSALDKRNFSLLPQDGYRLDLSTEFAIGNAKLSNQSGVNNVLAEENKNIGYVKSQAKLSTYFSIWREIVWLANFKVGYIHNFSSSNYVPLFKRFYLGGTDSVRGFSEDQILPADNNYPNKDSALSLGGNFFGLIRNELQFPIYKEIKGGFFVDVGELLENPLDWHWSNVSVGCGFGIRYQTPIGPLLFDLGVRVYDGNQFLSQKFLDRLGLHFSIGY